MTEGDISIHDILIWTGAAVTLAGLAALIWCILRVSRIRRSGLDDARMRAALQKVVPVNLGALLLSILGLILVIMGIMLG